MIRIILKMEDQVSGNMGKATSSLKSFGDGLTSVGTKLSIGLTAPLVAAGGAAVKMAMDLDTQMRNIQSISKQTDAEIAALSDTFVDMSTDITKTTDSAVNLASAFYDIQGSGFEGADAMKVLEAATKAATAGLTETQNAATGITAVLNSYGMSADEAARVSDLMFQTVNLGVGSFEELTSSMSNVVGLAATLDVPFETVSAALATMSKQGMSFSEASVAMNQAMSNLLNPTREGAEIITKMGYASGEAMVAALGFDGALQAIAEHTGGSATEMGKLFSNTRSMRAALALTGNGAQMFAEDMEAMQNATGAAGEAFAIQTKSFEAQFKNFQNNLNAMLIEIGNILLPIINDFLQNFLLPMIQGFRGLPEPIQKAVVIFGMLAAALGPVLIVIGSVISAISSIGALFATGGIFAGIVPVIAAVGATLSGLLVPIGLIAGAIGLLTLAWKTNFLGIQTFVGNIRNGISEIGRQFQNAETSGRGFLHVFEDGSTRLGEILNEFGIAEDKAQAIGRTVTQGLITWRDNFKMFGEIVALTFVKSVQYLSDFQKKIADAGGWGAVMSTMGKAMVQGLINGISGMISSLVNKVKEMASKASNAVRNAFGIRSPSKLMMRYGEQVVAGFNKGIDTMGGIGVQTPALAPAGASVSSTASGSPAFGSSNGRGGVTVIIEQLNVPLAENKAQIDYIVQEIGKKIKLKGGG